MSRGKNFEADFKRSLEDRGAYVHRINDAVSWNGRKMVGAKTPADFIVWWPRKGSTDSIMVECKAVSGTRIPFDRVQSHQAEALTAFDGYASDTHGVVAVNFYDPSNRSFNHCFIIPIGAWMHLKDADGHAKSLSYKECVHSKDIFELPKAPHGSGVPYDATPFPWSWGASLGV